MGAALLVGEELLGGLVGDRNLPAIARALAKRGVVLEAAEVVGDDPEAIAGAMRRLARRAGLLVVSGGIGPTRDDRTREGLARAMGVSLREEDPWRRRLEEALRARGLEPGEAGRRQARFPEGAQPVENRVGSAPGLRARLGGCEVWVLPGVPEEARAMVEALARELPEPAAPGGAERLVSTCGWSEVRLAHFLEEGGFRPPPGVALGYLPGPGGVRVRLWAPPGQAQGDLERAEVALREILGKAALPERTIEESLLRVYSERGWTLASAESCTGGLLGARITDVPGASSVYLGGVVAYADRAKTERLGVRPELLRRHGAVSEPVARAMAEGCRGAFGSAAALALTGLAGPGGGTADKPVGSVWIALADPAGTQARLGRFRGGRGEVRERAVHTALEMAYRRAQEAAA